MTRDRLINGLILAGVLGIAVWIARHTYWTQVTVTSPLEGPAATNPFYSVERVLHAVGIQSRILSSLRFLPPTTEVVYVGDLSGGLVRAPLAPLERWVEGGGRLVVTGNAIWTLPALQTWSGISPAHGDPKPRPPRLPGVTDAADRECPPLTVRLRGSAGVESLRVCAADTGFGFASRRVPDWALEGVQGLQMLRTRIGRGSLIVLDPAILEANAFLREDDAQAFLDATQLGRGERLNLFNPTVAKPFPALLWRLGAPAIVCFGIAVVLLILRHLPRFGPPVPRPVAARRSLAEQIRANARLAARTGRLDTLRAAVSRALERAAVNHVAGYRSFNVRQRSEALASRAGVDPAALVRALTTSAADDAHAARSAIRLLEQARRAVAAPPSHPGAPHER
jgi:hypothetical protein